MAACVMTEQVQMGEKKADQPISQHSADTGQPTAVWGFSGGSEG